MTEAHTWAILARLWPCSALCPASSTWCAARRSPAEAAGSASGGKGTSFNIYDFTTKKWHQTWVSGATLLLLDGELRDGSMVLEGTTVGQDGAKTHQRITWTPVEDGVVTQVWDQSTDGETWNTVFDGRYTRR